MTWRTKPCEVIVGNIGVIKCESVREGRETFGQYMRQSSQGIGRAANEQVTLIIDGEIEREYFPKKQQEGV